ncbi:MAG: hypothetical protein JWM90_2357 [Thermoleophilia bacterium]|nr:hypothetical protein [Thermoleophilia bacterium]
MAFAFRKKHRSIAETNDLQEAPEVLVPTRDVLAAVVLLLSPEGDDMGFGEMVADQLESGYRVGRDGQVRFVEPNGVLVLPRAALHELLSDFVGLGVSLPVAREAVRAMAYGRNIESHVTLETRAIFEQVRADTCGSFPIKRMAFDAGAARYYIEHHVDGRPSQ